MEKISLKQHIIHPFEYSSNSNVSFRLSSQEKIKAIALLVFVGILTAGIGGIVAFYCATAFYKAKRVKILNKNNAGSNIEVIPPQINPNNRSGKENTFRNLQPKEITTALDKFSLNREDVNSNYVDPATLRTLNQNQPFLNWLQSTYKNENAAVRKNIQNLISIDKIPLDQGTMIGIRGDLDCTMRSLYVGLLMSDLKSEQGLRGFQSNIKRVSLELEKLAVEANDVRLNPIIANFKKASKDALSKIDVVKEKCEASSDSLNTLFEELLARDFDKTMVLFIKGCSSLMAACTYAMDTASNKLDAWYVYLLLSADNENVLETLNRKSNYDPHNVAIASPDQANMTGSIVDVCMISKLFKKNIMWMTAEERGDNRQLFMYENGREITPEVTVKGQEIKNDEFSKERKDVIYLLNQAGHTNVVLL